MLEGMADWSITATTLGASAITGAVGYFGARLQAAASIRQVDAENERLRVQNAEDHLRNRQTTYHRLLDLLHNFDIAAWSGPGVGQSAFQTFLFEFGHLHNGAILFGTDDVSTAAKNLGAAIGQVEFHVGIGTTPFDEALSEGLDAMGHEIATARRNLTEAMRRDVAPQGETGLV